MEFTWWLILWAIGGILILYLLCWIFMKVLEWGLKIVALIAICFAITYGVRFILRLF